MEALLIATTALGSDMTRGRGSCFSTLDRGTSGA